MLIIMTWDHNQESVFLQMDLWRMRECRQRCFESSLAILLPQLLHYSPSVEEWNQQMRSSLYLFAFLFSLTDTELPRITEITCPTVTAKYFTKSFWPMLARALHHFVSVDRLDSDMEKKNHITSGLLADLHRFARQRYLSSFFSACPTFLFEQSNL